MKDADLHAVIGPDFNRLFAGIPTPEAPMPYAKSPDFGHPMQDHDEPKPIDYTMTPAERDRAKIASIDLERQRRERNKADADRDLVKLGVVFTDDGPEAA